MLTGEEVQLFRDVVWDHYHTHQRDLPWRDDPTPYQVMVSEFMLQQTQVGRVIPKFQAFMALFPTIESLADASLPTVLGAWSGLGYNRRAKFLHAAAQRIVSDFDGLIPRQPEELETLPGIGKNTAGAILAYAYNLPALFIETNIRSVYFYHFFEGEEMVDDRQLIPLLAQTVDHEHIREWYWALMDYGTYLKQAVGNNISRSKHYARQSKFEGSRRQLRGSIIRYLLAGVTNYKNLARELTDERLDSVIDDLEREGFILKNEGSLRLTGERKLP